MHRLPKEQHALGLVEVLVVLAIVATTMVAATQLSIQSLVKIKEDEITDFATGRMIQAMEIVKSPDSVRVNNALGTVTAIEGTFRIDISEDTQQAVLFQEVDRIERSEDCTRDNVYFIESPQIDEFTNPVVCLQVLIEDTGLDGENFYEITTRVIFKLSEPDNPVVNEYSGYRRDVFEQATI